MTIMTAILQEMFVYMMGRGIVTGLVLWVVSMPPAGLVTALVSGLFIGLFLVFTMGPIYMLVAVCVTRQNAMFLDTALFVLESVVSMFPIMVWEPRIRQIEDFLGFRQQGGPFLVVSQQIAAA